MLFKRPNRGAEEVADVESEGGGVAVATKKRKHQEMLSSVVKESTVGAAVALLKENTPFALPNGNSWLVLGLPAANIGGLSMKQKNDEAKGSLIELITADEITTVATAEMLDDESFGIIPSAKSLSRMDEFSLLKDAEYFWVVLTQSPEGALLADPVAEASYVQAVAVAEGHSTIAQILPAIWAWGGGEAAAEASEENASTEAVPTADSPSADEPLTGDAAAFVDGDSPFGDNPADDEPINYDDLASEENDASDPDALSAYEQEFVDQADQVDGDEQGTGSGSHVADAGDQEYFHDDREVTEVEVRSSIARRFLSSDLNLEVDLETFETNFNTGSPIVSFPLEDDASDWLGRQVNQLARQANTELEQLHVDNQNSLRELYVQLMSKHVERVIVDVSPDREGSYYSRLMQAAKDDLAERQRTTPEEVSALRRELNERYESEAQARGRQAAEQAMLRYKEQNRPRHERELAEVGLNAERASEEFFDGAQQIILETRRKDAQTRVDLGKTKILDVLMDRQQEHREAEEALLRSWSAQMMSFIDDNRKNDVARSEALTEQLSRDNQLEELRAEHATRVQQLRAEQEARVTSINSEIERFRSEATAELNARESTWTHTLSLERQKVLDADSRTSDLLTQFEQLGPAIEEQYKKRIASLEDDKESYSLELERASKIQSRANKVMVVLIIVLAFAALAVGFIIGAVVSGSQAAPAAAAASVWLDAGDFFPTF